MTKRVYEKPQSSRIEAPEHEMNHSYVDPGLARLLAPLVILAEAAVAAQPGERPLHDPPPLQDLEFLLPLATDHHLEDPTADLPGPLGDPAVVDPIRQDLLQPWESADHLAQDQLGAVPVLDARRVDRRGDDHPQGVDHQVPLPPIDLLECILAARPAALGGLDALAVDDAHARALLPPGAMADPGPEDVVDLG